MSSKKSVTRRLALFAGSSFAVAALSMSAVAITPTTAAAQATCTASTVVTGNGTSTVTIAGGTSNPGVTCTFTGDATVSTLSNLTVSTSGGDPLNPLVNGVNLVGGANDVTWVSTAGSSPTSIGTLTGGAQTNGPVLDVTTTTGAINITTGNVSGTNATVTDGIRAISGSGDISINNHGNVQANSAASNHTGIRAVTGGAGSIDLVLGDQTLASVSNGAVRGRLIGIYAEVASGDLSMLVGREVNGANVGIHAVGGAGSTIAINLDKSQVFESNQRIVSSSAGAGILIDTLGDTEINLGEQTRVVGATWGIDANTVAGSTTTVSLDSYDLSNNNGRMARLTGGLRMTGAGSLLLDNDGWLQGVVDTSAFDGDVEVNTLSRGVWFVGGGPGMAFGDGDVLLTTAAGGEQLPFTEAGQFVTDRPMLTVGGIIYTGHSLLGAGGASTAPATLEAFGVEPIQTIDFGGGTNAVDNAGYFFVGALPNSAVTQYDNAGTGRVFKFHEVTTELIGLETFTNRGVIMLGGISEYTGNQNNYMGAPFFRSLTLTDGWYDDILSMPGATFKGSRVVGEDGQTALRWNGDLAVGEIWYDIDPSRTQTDCSRDATTGDLQAADCLILDGGATDVSDGLIYVRLVEPVAGDRGVLNFEGITLIDMGDTGTSAQGHVAISPNQRGYNPRFGGYVDKGIFGYVIAYDESANQHKLFSVPSDTAWQLPIMAQAAHSLWRLSTGSWFDRQADLRGEQLVGVGGGVWARVSGEQAERDFSHTVALVGQDFIFDESYRQDSYAATAGADLLYGADGQTAYVAGLTLGYAHSDLEYDTSSNVGRYDAWSGGAYASFISGGLFVDASLTGNNVVMDLDAPGMDLFPAGTIVSTRLTSIGLRAEAGWRLPMFTDTAFVEGLAGLAYVRSRFDDLVVPADDPARLGVNAEFDDPTSLRLSIGGRAGVDQDFGVVRAQFSGLVRLWNEFEDSTTVRLVNPGDTAVISDDFSGQFTELGLGASVFSPGGTVSGFVNLGGRFGDDYQATTASAGVRVNW